MAKRQTVRQKQYKRVSSFIRRAEKRGYRFAEEFKEDIKSFSAQKLKKLTPTKLYSKATALTESGEIVSGLIKRGTERQASYAKGQETKAKKITRVKLYTDYTEDYAEDYPKQASIVIDIIEDFINTLQPIPISSKYMGTRYYNNFQRIYEAQVQAKTFVSNTWEQNKGNALYILAIAESATQLADKMHIIKYDSEATNVESALTDIISIMSTTPLSLEDNSIFSAFDEYETDYSMGDEEGFY